MRFPLSLIILALCCLPCSGFEIVEFCPDPYLPDDTDEYLVISGSGSLDRVTVSDGEGGFRFPKNTVMNGSLTIARQAVAYYKSHGSFPDFEWFNTSPEVPDVISGDKIRMANSQDELMLYENGVLIQQISWPADVKTREGQIHYFRDGIWDRRPLFLGQSDFIPVTFSDVTVTAFVSPDCAMEVFNSALDSAHSSIHLNVYEFSSTAISSNLIRARERGTDVLVLVEGGPVGGISPEEKTVLWNLNQSGIPVYRMGGTTSEKIPYRFDHAKYVVIDGKSVLLTSENFKKSGIPEAGYKGNRGWGVYLEDPRVAGYFDTVFNYDIGMKTSVPAYGTDGPGESESTIRYDPEFQALEFSGATVTPVISPDTSYLIADLISGAEASIEIEQAYITNESPVVLNPYLSAAIDASRRGVHVRILLDSYWYNVEDKNDNDEMVATINRIARTEHLPLEAKCAALDQNNLEKIHNKGVIVDNKSVLVSSINWNSNSPNFNREAGVIIQHNGVAGYFRSVFEDDWNSQVKVQEHEPDLFRYACLIIVIISLLILFGTRRCRR